MISHTTERFRAAYQALPEVIRRQAREAYQFSAKIRHIRVCGFARFIPHVRSTLHASTFSTVQLVSVTQTQSSGSGSDRTMSMSACLPVSKPVPRPTRRGIRPTHYSMPPASFCYHLKRNFVAPQHVSLLVFRFDKCPMPARRQPPQCAVRRFIQRRHRLAVDVKR